MKRKTTKHRLMELAGLIKEGSSDRDVIAHFVWSKDEFMEESEDTLEKLIDELEQEFNASKGNYSNVEEYLDELEQSGGLEGMLNEMMKTSKHHMRHSTSKIRLMELAGLIKEAESNIYAYPYEPGAVFEEGQYDQITIDELRTRLTDMDEDLPNELSIYAYNAVLSSPQSEMNGKKCIVVDLDEGGFVYSKQALDPKQLMTIAKAAIRNHPIYTNRDSNSLSNRYARSVKIQQLLLKLQNQV